jgi:hypothetical protein
MGMKALPLSLAIAALLPATASAAQPWSAPVDVIPSPGLTAIGNSAPEVFVAGGRSLVAAGSGENALLARGSATNVFSAPITVGTAPGGNVGVDAATAPDGTVAVAWVSGGSGHVSIVAPGGEVKGQADLPGGGVNAIGIAMGADGSTIVAYRTKEGPNAYSLRVAVAGPGSTTFGEPAVIESGAATDSIDVATGPGGAAAIAYRKLAGKYRTRVAVRPAGAGAFEPGQAMTTAGDVDDFTPRVAFDSDGTLVAAWGNPAGGLYALRHPGETAFGAAAPLGSGTAYNIDLEPTPGGAAVVGVAGGGSIRVASQSGPGSAFGDLVPVGPSFQSQLPGRVAVTTTPGGVTTAVFADPTTGEVHAVDAGGGDQVIGYGSKEAETSVEVASAGDRTVAVWTNAGGAIVAATRSATVKPATPGSLGAKPEGRDTKPPVVTYASGTKRFRVTTKTKTLKIKVRCSEDCKLLVTGFLRTQLSSKVRRSIAPMSPVQTTTAKSGIQTVTLKLGTTLRRDLAKALRRNRGGRLYLTIQATDASSNTARTLVQLTLRPAGKR